MTTAIHAAPIAIAEEQLDDLKRRLDNVRWPSRETAQDWSQGVPLAYVQELCEYWRHRYDWRRWEKKLNSFSPQKTVIDGLGIQFLHVRSPHANALPMVMTHGWPGSLTEFHKVIEPLTNPTAFGGNAEDAFHVVCPSLPGYGFSDKPTQPGWGLEKIAQAWNELMPRLGYDRYVAQGGDWGSAVVHHLALSHTDHCFAAHVNMPLAMPDPDTMNDLTTFEKSALAGLDWYQTLDSGYSKQQSTRPQTLAYALADSPVGQLTWILEKFWAWTDCGEGAERHPEKALTKDEMLDNITTYWLTNSSGSSAQLYWESFSNQKRLPITTPMGISNFPREIFRSSRRWAEKRYLNLIHYNEVARGGHFAAFEQPELFVDEVRVCFKHVR
ncbi:MAG: epoxide hydrolase [Verrucomicrobiaceae bacterium]|nr:epoxide hydrolase [Verrucomicrobiaceae bacterium]